MKMPIKQYNLSSEDYRSAVFSGFSRLQKEQEFVDLTLAADGCFCKVHRSLIALASPYLRDILTNLHGNAPVIFLNKIRKEILEYIIEYIYKGNVNIPLQFLEEFIEVSKSLHIAGISEIEPPKVSPEPLKSTTRKAKKRKFRERVPKIGGSKSTDCTKITQLYESANTVNSYNDSNDDYSMGDQNILTDEFELHSSASHDQESNKPEILKNANEDLITFHATEEQNYPSIYAVNEQPLEIPTETTPDLIDQPYKAQSYKIIVKPSKTQTEATENIPVIEIQPCLTQPKANIIPDHNNIESSVPVFNIVRNDNINEVIDYNTQSSQVSQPLIGMDTITDQNNEENSNPVFTIIRNDVTKDAGTENESPSLFQVSQPLIEIATIPDQNNEGKSKPVIEIVRNVIIKNAETNYVIESSQVSQPLIEIDSIPDQNNEGKPKPESRIYKKDGIKSSEEETPPFHVSLPPMQTNVNLNQSNVENYIPSINILSNQEAAETEVDESNVKATLNDMKNMAQYSITERGALQLILNRFIYCCHGISSKKLRWRCIDYRRGACPAIVDTGADGVIVYRKGVHGHEFHDKKILHKHKGGLIFSTMALAKIANELKKKEGTNIVSVDEIED